jgi:hypothetical protein
VNQHKTNIDRLFKRNSPFFDEEENEMWDGSKNSQRLDKTPAAKKA